MSISEILMLLTLIVTTVHVTFEIHMEPEQRENTMTTAKEKVTASASPSHGHLIFWSFDP